MGRRARKKTYSNRKRREKQDRDNVIQLNHHNQQAIKEGPRKKTWSKHDIRFIKPLTEKQEEMFHAWANGYNIFAHGCAGTGKTFLASFLAFTEYLNYKEHDKIMYIRSAVPSRDMGFLPGTVEEKTEQFEAPYKDILADLFGRSKTYEDMKDNRLVDFKTTSYIRGLTWDNAIIILDEVQNLSFSEIDTVMTRIGNNTRIIACGDTKRQCDLAQQRETSGIYQLENAVNNMKDFASVEFNVDDIVRSDFSRDWLMASGQI